MVLEQRTARLTVLIDPRKKSAFELLCAEEDTTPSQVVRRLIRSYIEERTGRPWSPESWAVEHRGQAGDTRQPAARPSATRRVGGRGARRLARGLRAGAAGKPD